MNGLRTTLDTGKETYNALKCKQNDDRTLILTLLSNGVTWTPEAGSILELRGKRSDSTVTIQTTTGITIANNVVTIALSKEFTKIQGTVELELNIRKLTEITTFTFILVIEPSVIQDGAIVSKNTSSVLDELNNVLDWGSMHLVKAVNNIVSLTKKHGQYSVGLTSGTRVVLPTVKQGEYVNIDYMFYADSDLGLVFDDNIKWSNRPIIQAGRSYRFSFRYVNGVWYGEWVKLERYIKDYIYKAGDTCDVLTGGYDLERIVNSGSITADFNRYNIGLWVTKDAQINLATISSIDLTNYTKLYLNLYYKAVSDYIGSSKRLSVTIGSTVILPPRPTVVGGGRNTIHVLDVSSITGSHQISFNTPGTTGTIGVDIYEAWLEKDEFVDTTQEIFTKSEKNKLASISASANKVANSPINGNILIDNVETKVYTHPIGTNPHGTTKSDVGLSNVDNTTDLNKPISTATQAALDGKIDTSQKGVANGIAQLNSNGVVPSSQLPSYVDDVLEYTSNSLFPATGESGKIYINTTTNITYRWTGSGYAEISPSIALGETSSTAYAGDKGKATTDKVNGHLADKASHITSAERTNWNGKQSALGFTPYNATNPKGYITSSASITGDSNGLTSIDGDRNANTKLPTGSPKCLRLDFVTANSANGGGDFSGLMTYSPWDGTSAGGGGCSYQLSFSSTVHNGGIPYLSIRNGIHDTWNTWHRLATQTDINNSINAIQIGGRNLIVKSGLTRGSYLRDTGIVEPNGDWAYTDFIPVEVGKQYLTSGYRNLGDSPSTCFYNADKVFVSGIKNSNYYGIPANDQRRIVTIPNGCSYMRFSFEIKDLGTIKLEKGNKATDWTPAPEDVQGQIDALAKELSTVSTSTFMPPSTKRWTRLATLRVTVQYQGTNIQFNIMNNDTSMDFMTAIVSAGLKQQTAMGTNPYTGVVVNGVGFNANNFKAIITTSATASTLDLYVSMNDWWGTFSMSKTLSANNLSTLTPLQPFIDLPADAKFATVIFK